QPDGPVTEQRDLIPEICRKSVGILRGDRMIVARGCCGYPITRGGSRVDELLDPCVARSLEHSNSALHVCLHVLGRALDRRDDVPYPGKVEHVLCASEYRGGGSDWTNVASVAGHVGIA